MLRFSDFFSTREPNSNLSQSPELSNFQKNTNSSPGLPPYYGQNPHQFHFSTTEKKPTVPSLEFSPPQPFLSQLPHAAASTAHNTVVVALARCLRPTCSYCCHTCSVAAPAVTPARESRRCPAPLSPERSVAVPDWKRWSIPPARMASHFLILHLEQKMKSSPCPLQQPLQPHHPPSLLLVPHLKIWPRILGFHLPLA